MPMQQKNNCTINQSGFFISLFGLTTASVLILNACGVDERPHYPDKRFGQGPGDPDADGTGTDDVSSEPANQTLLHQEFTGYFDLTSVRAIYYGEDPNNGHVSQDNGLIDNAIGTALSFIIPGDAKEKLEMLVQQQSKEIKAVTQTVQTDGGDALSKFKGEDPQSGSQFLEWVVGSGQTSSGTQCPKTFVCIKRMVWKPSTGKPFTYCYRDYATKAPVAIPYSANSNFTKEAYERAIGKSYVSKPIEVTSHPGEVACDDPEKITHDVNTVTYKLSLGDLSSQASPDFHRKATNKPIKADTEVVIEHRLHDVQRDQPYIPKKGPFIDQRTRLNSKIKFFLNSSEHVVTKIERTVMSPFKFGTTSTVQFLRDAYGETVSGAFSALTGPENNIEGIQVNYSFEFCTHLSVIKNPYNHCTGQAAP